MAVSVYLILEHLLVMEFLLLMDYYLILYLDIPQQKELELLLI